MKKTNKLVGLFLALVFIASQPITALAAAQPTAAEVFAGYTVTIHDTTTPAVDMRGRPNVREYMCFVSSEDVEIGVMLYSEYQALISKHGKVVPLEGGGSVIMPPDGSESWNIWLADQFNKYRGIETIIQPNQQNTPSNSTGGSNSNPGSSAIDKSDWEDTTNFSNTRIDIEEARQEIIRQTNNEREKAGLPPLEINKDAMEFAQIRANEISTKFSHERPNGRRISEYGYGENIGPGHPTWAVSEWMASSGHKANILNERYTIIGVGVYQNDEGYLVGVQLFSSRPRSIAYHESESQYSISDTEISLQAGDSHQLSILSSGSSNYTVEWSLSSLADGKLEIDGSGMVTALNTGTNGSGSLTVTAKVYESGRHVKTLTCKVKVNG